MRCSGVRVGLARGVRHTGTARPIRARPDGAVDAATLWRKDLRSEAAPRGILMEVNAIQQMLSRLRQVQEDLQRQVNSVAVEASAGGGRVTVKMNGQKQSGDNPIEAEGFRRHEHEVP